MKWIWTECNEGASFGEFRLPFTYKEGRTILKISSEYRHVAYINGNPFTAQLQLESLEVSVLALKFSQKYHFLLMST